MIEPMLSKIDLIKSGGDLLQAACFHGKRDLVELLIKKGADIMNAPGAIPDDPKYRRSPFMLQAAASGSIETIECVLEHGGAIADRGFITLSKKKKNQVVSNVIGCAAFHGRKKLLEHVLRRVDKSYLEFKAVETQDTQYTPLTESIHDKKFEREFNKFTPLMLCVVNGDQNLDCVKVLLNNGADFNAKDDCGNNLLHIAASYGHNKMLDYFTKNLKIGIFERNNKGETALTICQTNKNKEGINCLEQFTSIHDNS